MSRSTLDSRSEHVAVGGQIGFLVDTLTLDVTDEDADGVWVATDDFSTVYGNGESPGAAIRDYLASLAGQFNWLDSYRSELSGSMLHELTMLERILDRASQQ